MLAFQSLNELTLQRISLSRRIFGSGRFILLVYYYMPPLFPLESICMTGSGFSLENKLPRYHALLIHFINSIYVSVKCFNFCNSFYLNCIVNGTRFNLPIFRILAHIITISVLSNSNHLYKRVFTYFNCQNLYFFYLITCDYNSGGERQRFGGNNKHLWNSKQ